MLPESLENVLLFNEVSRKVSLTMECLLCEVCGDILNPAFHLSICHLKCILSCNICLYHQTTITTF